MSRNTALLFIAWLLGGCAATPPVPPECIGALMPINAGNPPVQKETQYEPRP